MIDEVLGILDLNGAVSARYLATQYNFSIDEAELELCRFLEERNGHFVATFLVSGKVNESKFNSFAVCLEDELEDCKLQFSHVSRVSVYGLLKHQVSNWDQLFSITDTEQANRCLLEQGSDSLVLNKIGAIRCSSVKVSPPGARCFQEAAANKDKSGPKETPAEQISRVFAIKTASKPPPSAVTNFFKSTSMNKVASDDSNRGGEQAPDLKIAVEEDEPETEQPKPTDDDGEFDDSYRPDKSKLVERAIEEYAKRPTSHIKDEVNEETEAEPTKRNPKTPKKQVRGGMDDYLEDVAIAEELARQETVKSEAMDPDQENLNANAPSTGKAKRRKLVEKITTDEKGYLVTEMVWEEVSDKEDDCFDAVRGSPNCVVARARTSISGAPEYDKIKSSNAASAVKEPLRKIPSSSTARKPMPTTQKSVMSFFGKK